MCVLDQVTNTMYLIKKNERNSEYIQARWNIRALGAGNYMRFVNIENRQYEEVVKSGRYTKSDNLSELLDNIKEDIRYIASTDETKEYVPLNRYDKTNKRMREVICMTL